MVRLSVLEEAVLTRLAVAREPAGFRELAANLGPGAALNGFAPTAMPSAFPSVRRAAIRHPLIACALDDVVGLFGFLVPTHIKLDVDGADFDILQSFTGLFDPLQVIAVQLEVKRRRAEQSPTA